MRHLDVHAYDVGLELARQLDGLLAVGGLADDVVAVVLEHRDEVHAVDRFVFGDDDGRLALLRLLLLVLFGLARRVAVGGERVELLLGEDLFFVFLVHILYSHPSHVSFARRRRRRRAVVLMQYSAGRGTSGAARSARWGQSWTIWFGDS